MDDRDFFDELYLLWSKTTGAKDHYWMPVEDTGYYVGGPETFLIYAVGQDESRKDVASFLQNEADADFITAIHGCLPDLVRRLHNALDEADRADYEKDSRECRIAELEMEVQELEAELKAEREPYARDSV